MTVSLKTISMLLPLAFVFGVALAQATPPARASVPAAASRHTSLTAPATADSIRYRVIDAAPQRECGTICDKCSPWRYAGLCKLGIKEKQMCVLCQRDCDTGEKRCSRWQHRRCKARV